MPLIREKWKELREFKGNYKVSSFGRVRSNFRTQKTLKPKIDKDGYHEYGLRLEGKTIYRRGHRLVASEFIDNKLNLPVINHKNGVKHSNIWFNLEWTTVAKNTIHAYDNLIKTKGKCLSNLSQEEFKELVNIYLAGADYTKIKQHFSLDCHTDEIADVLKARRFSELTGLTKDIRRPYSNGGSKMDRQIIYNVLEDFHRLGVSQVSCCRKYNLTAKQVSLIVNGKSWKDIYKDFMGVH